MKYYSDLYTSDTNSDYSVMQNFLEKLNIPLIDHIKKEELDQPFQITEILNSIRTMQSSKTPGPDGYPVEFYKTFSGVSLLVVSVQTLNMNVCPIDRFHY